MNFITEACKVVGGVSFAVVALSMMWVMLQLAVKRIPDPPRALFIGMFGIYASALFWAGSSLLIRGTILP